MAADWLKIKSEYVSGNISYRKLAEKHGVSFNTLKDHAMEEKWKECREKQYHKTTTKTQQKAEEKISDALSDEAALKVQIRAGLFRLAADWIANQEVIGDTNDYRRMVQSCVDLGVLEVQEAADVDGDGLLEALGNNVSNLFGDGDDSDILPKGGEA